MTFGQLLLRNLRFHWRGNLAVLLGVAVGTAVLTGALLVGDSLRGSLRGLSESRLGWVDHALTSNRFFREEVTTELDFARLRAISAHRDDSRFTLVHSIIVLRGSVRADSSASGSDPGIVRRAGQVTIWGTNENFWIEASAKPEDALTRQKELPKPTPEPPATSRKQLSSWNGFWDSSDEQVVLSAQLASDLGVRAGDMVSIGLQKVSQVPRETLLGRRDVSEVVDVFSMKVRDVLPKDDFGSQFSLQPAPGGPRNAFIPLRALQKKLQQPVRVNGLLIGGGLYDLPDVLPQALTLADWGLVLWSPATRVQSLFAKLDRNGDGQLSRNEWRDQIAKSLADRADPKTGILTRQAVLDYYRQRGYLSLESRQMLVEPAVAEAALATAKELNLTAAPTLVYLANRIAEGNKEIPYSVVAALDPSLPAPLGPFLPAGAKPLADDEIVLAGWKDSPLPMKPGDVVSLTYFQPELHGKVEETTTRFKLRGIVPMTGVADDPDLTPEFPGITDKLSLRDWNPPFPYDNKRVKKVDETYWNEYRTTPKAYISLAAGQKLWGSRYGDVTSIRLAPSVGADLDKAAADFTAKLLSRLKPEQGGFVFDPVRQRALNASVGGNDFGGLFLGFSFFLIAAALLLVGLLFRLNLDRRASEFGLLLALGFRRSRLRWLLLSEGLVLSAVGALIGSAGAVLYAYGLIELLNALWPGGLDRSFLRLHVTPLSFAIGYGSALAVSLLTIAWAVRILGKASPRNLLAGETTASTDAVGTKRGRWSRWLAIGCPVLGLVLIAIGPMIRDHEAQAGTFFSGGALLLTAGLAGLAVLLRRARERTGTPRRSLALLAVRNAARHPTRSLLTAGLLASAAFLIVAVESFRRQPDRDFLDKHSGSGGFVLLGEADVPVYQDLNRGPGRDEITDALERQKLDPARLEGVTFFPFRLRAGDDASCLNLYQPGRPRLLGVTPALVQRGGFQFAETLAETPEEKANPWLLLAKPSSDGTIPVFGEANTVVWMLKSKLGGVIEVPDERGSPAKLRIVGLLRDSVFQGELLLSEGNFLKLYPASGGYSFFLIEAPAERVDEVKGLLDTALADRGFEATPSATRLAAYLAVENTYLSTFQALGGLGLILGALGLAVVLLRGVWERRGELALLRALGFRRGVLSWMVLVENAFLLIVGLGIGVGAALLSVAPHLLTGESHLPWLRLVGLLAAVVAVGLITGGLAVRATLRAPLIPALRRE